MKLIAAFLLTSLPLTAEPPSWSGIYPKLASFNNVGECGTGAVVPWADRLWVITYGPHLPFGSSDKLYEITPDLQQIVRNESVGGTPANRMIHRESQQLVIGPYFIDRERNVRVVSPKRMPGRLTGNARHLLDPAGKIYFATMEEGLYEVDVHTLEVTGLIKDGNPAKPGMTEVTRPAPIGSKLPGYHGKGLYSGQGRVIYANNGENSSLAQRDPRTISGALAEWNGAGDWQLVRRNQFTEVTGPGGIEGSENPDTDPVWSMGWDSRSLILMMLDGGKWHVFRLPKGSHCYDGAHGWNTEWPRIRDIGESDLLMTMHGTFWKFPKSFSAAHTAGIRPRSTYLKVIGDFCKWNDRLVFGCDDTAKSAFLNSGSNGDLLASPGQSQSNLWFTSTATPDLLGPVIGRGAVWLREDVKAESLSDPFLFAGYQRRTLHLSHRSTRPVTFTLEIDVAGDGKWRPLREITVPAEGAISVGFTSADQAEWIRIRAGADCAGTTAAFVHSNPDPRGNKPDTFFDGLTQAGSPEATSGWLRARGDNKRSLLVSLPEAPGQRPSGRTCYELGSDMKLVPVTSPPGKEELQLGTSLPVGKIRVEEASVVYTDASGANWRLPRGISAFDGLTTNGLARLQREVCTERYLLNCHGTFYEFPTENAGGISKIRPVSSHRFAINDFASYRGLLVMTGIDGGLSNSHIIRSDDGKAAVWAGAVDDLWKLGKPAGKGGPWLNSGVKASVPSDPYLFTGYDRKHLTLSHSGAADVSFKVELDITGEGDWIVYQNFAVKAGETFRHDFTDSAQAYWVRITPSADATATAQLEYD